MKITILTTQLGGTGGALNCILIANKLVKEGHEVRVFSESMPGPYIGEMLAVKANSIRDLPQNLKSDVVIAFNMTSEIEKRMRELEGKKVFRVGIITQSFYPIFQDKDILKIAVVSSNKKFIDSWGGPCVAIPGPVDMENFFPEPLWKKRSNIALSYLKKSGWVGVAGINLAQDVKREIVLGTLGEDGVGSIPIKSRYPITLLGAPAHLRHYVRYCYSIARLYVDTHSNGFWTWNCCVSEAMLCKCPVVCTNSPEFSDIVIEGETALTAQHDEAPEMPDTNWLTRPSPQKIADRVLELWDNPSLRARLVENAYENVRKFNIDNWYTEFMRLM